MSLIERVKTRLNKLIFQQTVRKIERTPPLRAGNTPVIALSMVHQRDVLPYLLAVKSFAARVNPARIVVIADPTLGQVEQQCIIQHVPFAEILPASNFARPDLPVGGTWERLIAISHFVRDDFVIQLDADTVSMKPMPEVHSAIEDGKAFTLATDDRFQNRFTCRKIAEWARGHGAGMETHVQSLAESRMDRLPAPDSTHYFRGCSGFAGFPRHSFDTEYLASFAGQMLNIVGEAWKQWGSEQVMSNLVVANMSESRLLPHARYCTPYYELQETAFLHFIGYTRFASRRYTRACEDFLSAGR